MRSNRLRGCLVVAALFAGTSSASAQDNTDEKTDEKTDQKGDEKTEEKTEKPPTPDTVTLAQAEASPQTGSPQTGPSPQTPGAREPMTEGQVRKMIEEQVKAARPRGPTLEFSG